MINTISEMEPAQPFTILVVDDEPPICELLARIAQKEFPQAHFVNTRSVQETYAYLDQSATAPPQLVLLDIDLKQVKDGLDLLPELRERFKRQVPIIMLSMLADEAKIQRSYEEGAVAYTQKPDDLAGWQQYVRLLRSYWQGAATLSTIAPPEN